MNYVVDFASWLGSPESWNYSLTLLLFFFIGAAAGLSGLVPGIPTLIAVPSFIALGLPPHMALGVQKLAAPGYQLGGLLDLFRSDNIDWKLLPWVAVTGFMGALTGTFIISHIDPGNVRWLIIVGIILAGVFAWRSPYQGVQPIEARPHKKAMGHVSYFCVVAWASSITVGVGALVTFIYLYFFGRTINQTRGTNKPAALLQNLVSIGVFGYMGFIIWDLGFAALLGYFVGGTMMVKLGLKFGNEWQKNLLVFGAPIAAVIAILASG